MTSTKDGTILKTDTKGRIRTLLARQERLLEEFERSSLCQRAGKTGQG